MGAIGLDCNLKIKVSSGVNGNHIVEKLFWDFDGKNILLPRMKSDYLQRGLLNGMLKRCLGIKILIKISIQLNEK